MVGCLRRGFDICSIHQHPSVIDERIEHVAVVMAMTRRIKEASEGGDDDDFDWTEGERTPPPPFPSTGTMTEADPQPDVLTHVRTSRGGKLCSLHLPGCSAPPFRKTPAAAHLTAATRGDAQPRRLCGFRVPHPDPDLETAPLLAGSGLPSQEKRRKTWR